MIEDNERRVLPTEYLEKEGSFRQVFSDPLIEPMLKLFIRLKLPYLFKYIPKNILYTVSSGFSWTFYGNYKAEMINTTKKIMGKIIDKKYKNVSKEWRKWIVSEIVYHNGIHMAEVLLETLMILPYFYMSRDFERYFKVDGIENLDKALKKGKGVIVVSAHIGNYLFTWSYLALKGYKINFILEYTSFSGIIDLLKNCGVKIIPIPTEKDEKLNKLVKDKIDLALKRNEIVVFMHDAGLTYYTLIDLFDEPCHTPLGAIYFALRHDSKIIPIFIKSYEKKHIHEITINSEFIIKKNNKKDELELILYNSYRLNKYIEREIKKNFVYWNNLAIFHIRKAFNRKILFKNGFLLDSLINEIQFFYDYLNFSYEINRDDERIKELLKNAKTKLLELRNKQKKYNEKIRKYKLK
ncbi:MAG: LpxL/LpxP family acyltransferase [Candidatus Helarchaeota archaeon]